MDDELQAHICARIKQARIEAGFTLQDAADALDVTLRAYQNYEKDRVPFRRLAEIASVFGVTQDWLLRGDMPAQPINSDEATQLLGEVLALRREMQEAKDLLARLLQEPPEPQEGTPRKRRA